MAHEKFDIASSTVDQRFGQRIYSATLFDAALGKLYHNKFRDVLNPMAYDDFKETMQTLREIAEASIIGDFIIQIWNSDEPGEPEPQPAFPNNHVWYGIHYTYVMQDGRLFAASDSRAINGHTGPQEFIERFDSDVLHTITLHDINWPTLSLATFGAVPHNQN